MRRLSWMMNGRDKMVSGLTLAGLTLAGLTLTSLMLSGSASAATLQVGAGKTYATPCQAQLAARDGDTIEIDAAVYADTCAWTQNNLVLRGVGGRPIITGRPLLSWPGTKPSGSWSAPTIRSRISSSGMLPSPQIWGQTGLVFGWMQRP